MTREAAAWALGLGLWLAGMCCGRAHAHAQTADDALTLARVVFHEAGLDGAADVPGIYAVITHGAERRGVSFAAMARAYSPRAHAGTTARAYAMTLAADCSRPRGYPLPWTEARRAQCVALLDAARAAIAAPPACHADDWGDRRDHERARLSGRRFRFVDCGPGARNLFSERLR